MKSKTLLTVILAIVLVSCTPMSISTPTETPVPTETLTPIPPTPTITPSPTETPDPNRPSDATGKDTNGYYKDVQENGKIIRYYWVELNYGDDAEKSIYKGWFASHVTNGSLNGSIPFYDRTGDNKMIPFYYYVQQNIQAPYIKYLGGIPQNSAEFAYIGFSSFFEQELIEKYLGKNFQEITSAERTEFYNDFLGGKITIPFTTPTGDYIWELTQTTGYKFYTINWDKADPATHPGFYETHWGKFQYRWTIYSDKEGNLVVIEANKFGDVMDAENLFSSTSSTLFLKGILFPMEQMLVLRQLPEKVKYWQGGFSLTPEGLSDYAFMSKCFQGHIISVSIVQQMRKIAKT